MMNEGQAVFHSSFAVACVPSRLTLVQYFLSRPEQTVPRGGTSEKGDVSQAKQAAKIVNFTASRFTTLRRRRRVDRREALAKWQKPRAAVGTGRAPHCCGQRTSARIN